jgi:acyl-CoA synthetase (NDP forming)
MKSSMCNNLLSSLDSIFNPKSVAIIGASSKFGKWGQLILSNIVAGDFRGKIFPVNPRDKVICGLPVYNSILDIPETVDLAFITTPAETVPAILEDCGRKGIKGIVLITSGFSEADEAGEKLEKNIVSICKEKDLLLVGPNTMGIICPYANLFATGTHTRPIRGSVAFISQSGNLGNQLIHWAEQQGIGVSLFVGSGNEAVLTCSDYLEYLEHDSRTDIIVLYVETVEEGRRFFDISKRVTRNKPVIVLKGGRTEAGQVAALSHTGSISGEEKIVRAAFQQAGLIYVTAPSELLNLSAGFSSLPLPKGNRVGIVTLGGGWGVVTSDECNEKGLVVPDIPGNIIETIGQYLPSFWSRGNPVDLVGTRDLDVPIVAVEELLKCDRIDAVISLGIVGRQELIRSMIQSTREVDPAMPKEFLSNMEAFSHEYEKTYIARIVELMETYEKPVIGVSLTRTADGTVRSVDGKRYNGVFYQTPENAVNVLANMVAYQKRIARL